MTTENIGTGTAHDASVSTAEAPVYLSLEEEADMAVTAAENAVRRLEDQLAAAKDALRQAKADRKER